MILLIACAVFAAIMVVSAVVGYRMHDVAYALYTGFILGLGAASFEFIFAGWLLALR